MKIHKIHARLLTLLDSNSQNTTMQTYGNILVMPVSKINYVFSHSWGYTQRSFFLFIILYIYVDYIIIINYDIILPNDMTKTIYINMR